MLLRQPLGTSMGLLPPSQISSSDVRCCRQVLEMEQLPALMPLPKGTRPQQGLLLLLRCWLATQQCSSSSLRLSSSKLLLHNLGLHPAFRRSPPVQQRSRRLRQLLSRSMVLLHRPSPCMALSVKQQRLSSKKLLHWRHRPCTVCLARHHPLRALKMRVHQPALLELLLLLLLRATKGSGPGLALGSPRLLTC